MPEANYSLRTAIRKYKAFKSIIELIDFITVFFSHLYFCVEDDFRLVSNMHACALVFHFFRKQKEVKEKRVIRQKS